MDNLQYNGEDLVRTSGKFLSFKPYYKWITFNTITLSGPEQWTTLSFKPYYKWITFNTLETGRSIDMLLKVLNLIING